MLDQLKEIRTKQGAGKNSRTAKLDQVKRLDEQLKARTKELKATKDLTGFRSEEDLDNKIQDLRAQVDTGKLKLVDEKKNLDEISKLNRSRKQFATIKEQQKGVDEVRAKIQEIKDTMNDPEAKALSDKYTTLQTELDGIKAEQDEAYKSLSSLRDERSKLQAQQREKYNQLKALKDEYHTQRKAFQSYEREQKQKAWERQRSERERQEKERKLERAQKMLAEASDPAFLDEIRRANSLLQYFDPTFVPEKAPLQTSTNLQAQAGRKVDDSGIKGVKLSSKKDREEDYAPAVKKGKKGKKHNAAATKSTFNCPPSVVEDSAYLGIDPPMSADEVPGVVEKVKAKLDQWKSDQETQTQRVSFDLTQSFVRVYMLTICFRTSRRPRRRSRRLRLRRPRRGRPRSPLPAPPRPMETAPPRTERSPTIRSRRSPRRSRRLPSKTRRRRRLLPHEHSFLSIYHGMVRQLAREASPACL